MGTIDKQTAEKIMAGDFPGDDVVKIVAYQNHFNGGLAYGYVSSREDINRFENSPACHNVQVVWTKPLREAIPETICVSYDAAVKIVAYALGWSEIKTQMIFRSDLQFRKPEKTDQSGITAVALGQFIHRNVGDINNKDEY